MLNMDAMEMRIILFTRDRRRRSFGRHTAATLVGGTQGGDVGLGTDGDNLGGNLGV
jgi:hypothetical protein